MSTESFTNIRTFLNGAVSIESPLSPVLEKRKKRISSCCSSEIHESVDGSSFKSESSFSDDADCRSVTSNGTKMSSTPNLLQNSDVDKSWIRKNSNTQIMEAAQALLLEKKENENRLRLERQRQNFQRWLANKKKQKEEEEQAAKEKLSESRSEKDYERERRNKEAELKYKLWCKRKEQQELEKKLKDKVDEIKASEHKQERIEKNKHAYKNWLKNSIFKPIPIPLNRGLETLRSSASVAFINPIPWQPNIEESCLNSSK